MDLKAQVVLAEREKFLTRRRITDGFYDNYYDKIRAENKVERLALDIRKAKRWLASCEV